MLIYCFHDDQRVDELEKYLIKEGYYVTDEMRDLCYADCLYLGVKGVNEKGQLRLNNITYSIQEQLEKLKEQCYIFTIAYNRFLDSLAKKYHYHYVCLSQDETFHHINSVISAEGIIAYLIKERKKSLYKSQVLICGYGFLSQALIQRLLGFHVDITVTMRNRQLVKELEKRQLRYLSFENKDLSEFDIIVNTIPFIIIDKNSLNNVKKDALLVDAASYPYGIDHHYALEHNLNSVILPSIPSHVGVESAGQLIGKIMEKSEIFYA